MLSAPKRTSRDLGQSVGIVCEVTLDTEGSPQTRLSHVWLAWTLPRPQGYGCSQIRCSVIHTGLQSGFFRPASPCPPWTVVGRGPQRESHPETGDWWPLWAWALHITPTAGPGGPAQWDTFLAKSCWGPAHSPPWLQPQGRGGQEGREADIPSWRPRGWHPLLEQFAAATRGRVVQCVREGGENRV